MAYEEAEARRLVIEAGKKLLEAKLVARTWGNVSARISDSEFIITPSGRAYETLKEEELVKVKIADLSYEGNIKPSSEKGIHAGAYAQRPDVNFVIHTHQLYASAVCAEGKDTAIAPCAAYGLPGTKKLKQNVLSAISKNMDKNCFLMARHGALCLGSSMEDAFGEANLLEQKCFEIVKNNSVEKDERIYRKPWLDDYAQLIGRGDGSDSDDKEAAELIKEKNKTAAKYIKEGKPLSFFDALLQRTVYLYKYSKLKK